MAPAYKEEDEEDEMLKRAISMSLEENKCLSWVVPELD